MARNIWWSSWSPWVVAPVFRGYPRPTTGRPGTPARCGPRSSTWSTCASDSAGSVYLANAIRVPSSSATDATRAHGQARRLRRLGNSPPCSPDCQRPRRRCPACGPTSRSRSQPPRRRRIAGLHFNGRDTSEPNGSRWPVSRSSRSGLGAELRQVVCQRPVPGRDRDGGLKRRAETAGHGVDTAQLRLAACLCKLLILLEPASGLEPLTC